MPCVAPLHTYSVASAYRPSHAIKIPVICPVHWWHDFEANAGLLIGMRLLGMQLLGKALQDAAMTC